MFGNMFEDTLVGKTAKILQKFQKTIEELREHATTCTNQRAVIRDTITELQQEETQLGEESAAAIRAAEKFEDLIS